ncbi:MAG: DNA helicase RecQ [Tepidisphaera sp.]
MTSDVQTNPRAGVEMSSAVEKKVSAELERVWGFSTLRPNQREAIATTLAGRNSLVVMPTGGGKSLCYQLPPLITGKLAVVVSPLIALMKDQVDGLRLLGYPAAALNSSVEIEDTREVWKQIERNELRLLFVSPERLFSPSFLARMVKADVRTIAVDEAHCISQWGHDFRPEYRRLRELHEVLPGVQINAYTATATPAVREDIVEQLQLKNPAVLVGVFDRPNLTYRVLPRVDVTRQAADAVRRHSTQASIIYCISRKDTESLADALRALKIDAKAYHAGLTPETRRRIQEDFANERLSVVVATVAFGMGIDRSDVRCVVHAGLPKSLEHYQQETGRAGRDGLPSECLMLYSAADATRWQMLFSKSVESGEGSPEWQEQQREHLDRMQGYCTSASCRHGLLSAYFGQTYAPPSSAGCGACDVCLGEVETVEDSMVIAQKILSAVARASQTRRHDGSLATFGVAHITKILKGSNDKAVREWGHDQHSTFGLLADLPKAEISSYIHQLSDMGFLGRTPGQFPTIYCTQTARDVLKGAVQVRLGRSKAITAEADQLNARDRSSGRRDIGVPSDPGMFEALRVLRRSIASERAVPPYVIFSDAVLEEIAAVRPTRRETFRTIRGVGERKLEDFGQTFARAIKDYCATHNLATDTTLGSGKATAGPAPLSPNKQRALPLFEAGRPIDQVASELNLATSTVTNYLVEFIQTGRIPTTEPWLAEAARAEILAVATKIEADKLAPVFEHFGGRYDWDHIRLAFASVETSRS